MGTSNIILGNLEYEDIEPVGAPITPDDFAVLLFRSKVQSLGKPHGTDKDTEYIGDFGFDIYRLNIYGSDAKIRGMYTRSASLNGANHIITDRFKLGTRGDNYWDNVLKLCLDQFYKKYTDELIDNLSTAFQAHLMPLIVGGNELLLNATANETLDVILTPDELARLKTHLSAFLKDCAYTAYPVFFLENVTRVESTAAALGTIGGKGVLIPRDKNINMLVIHEVGHNLGLRHTFDGVVDPSYIPTIIAEARHFITGFRLDATKAVENNHRIVLTTNLSQVRADVASSTLSAGGKTVVTEFLDKVHLYYNGWADQAGRLSQVIIDLNNQNYIAAYNMVANSVDVLFDSNTSITEFGNDADAAQREMFNARRNYFADPSTASLRRSLEEIVESFKYLKAKLDTTGIVDGRETYLYNRFRYQSFVWSLEGLIDIKGDLSLPQGSSLENIMDYVPNFATNSFIALQWDIMRTVASRYTTPSLTIIEGDSELRYIFNNLRDILVRARGARLDFSEEQRRQIKAIFDTNVLTIIQSINQ